MPNQADHRGTPLPRDVRSTTCTLGVYVLLTSAKLRRFSYVRANYIKLRSVGGIINDFVAVKGFHSVIGENDESPTCSQGNVEVNERLITKTRQAIVVN